MGEVFGQDLSGSGYSRVASSCECGDEPSSSMKLGKCLSIYQFLLFKLIPKFIFSVRLLNYYIKTTFTLPKNRYPSL